MKTTIRIIKKSETPKLSPTAIGLLTYHVGSDGSDACPKTIYIRVTANSGGGFFSNEWICLADILSIIKKSPAKKPFKALIFKSLYQSKGANNHGFLAAALRSEQLLLAVDKQPLSHDLGDLDAFTAAMQKLVDDNISLDDEVAAAEAIKEAKQAERIKKMKKAHKAAAKK